MVERGVFMGYIGPSPASKRSMLEDTSELRTMTKGLYIMQTMNNDFNTPNYKKLGSVLSKFLKNKENKVLMNTVTNEICFKNQKYGISNKGYVFSVYYLSKNNLSGKNEFGTKNNCLFFEVAKNLDYISTLDKKEQKEIKEHLRKMEKLAEDLTSCEIPCEDLMNRKLHNFLVKIHTSCNRRITYIN